MRYEAPEQQMEWDRVDIDNVADSGRFHPEDCIKVLENIAECATKRTAAVREKNENEGVPDR